MLLSSSLFQVHREEELEEEEDHQEVHLVEDHREDPLPVAHQEEAHPEEHPDVDQEEEGHPDVDHQVHREEVRSKSTSWECSIIVSSILDCNYRYSDCFDLILLSMRFIESQLQNNSKQYH